MKTDTVNKIRPGKWSVETYGQESVAIKSDQPDFDGLNRSVLIINHFDAEQRKMNEANAELIVAAVNACKEINPDNPLNAAKAIPVLLEALQTVRNMDVWKKYFGGGAIDKQLESAINKATE